jgi:NAD(P)-dependent dehydrogenase (short-subunit alcohol dehydrogenase family)
MQAKYDYSGKAALVIRGTTGIGRATALAFAEAGANLYVAGLGAEDGRSLLQEIKAGHPRVEAEFEELDVRRGDDVRAFHERAFRRFGRIDIAFNNAGVPGKTAPMHELSEADFYSIIDVDLKGVFLGLKNQIPHMIERGAARSSTPRRCSASWDTPRRASIARANGALSASPIQPPWKSLVRTSASTRSRRDRR